MFCLWYGSCKFLLVLNIYALYDWISYGPNIPGKGVLNEIKYPTFTSFWGYHWKCLSVALLTNIVLKFEISHKKQKSFLLPWSHEHHVVYSTRLQQSKEKNLHILLMNGRPAILRIFPVINKIMCIHLHRACWCLHLFSPATYHIHLAIAVALAMGSDSTKARSFGKPRLGYDGGKFTVA